MPSCKIQKRVLSHFSIQLLLEEPKAEHLKANCHKQCGLHFKPQSRCTSQCKHPEGWWRGKIMTIVQIWPFEVLSKTPNSHVKATNAAKSAHRKLWGRHAKREALRERSIYEKCRSRSNTVVRGWLVIKSVHLSGASLTLPIRTRFYVSRIHELKRRKTRCTQITPASITFVMWS